MNILKEHYYALYTKCNSKINKALIFSELALFGFSVVINEGVEADLGDASTLGITEVSILGMVDVFVSAKTLDKLFSELLK